MKKENSSSLKKLEMLFSKISETQERYIMISCSHVFSDKISFYIEKLKSQYQIIDFDDILNNSVEISKTSYSLPRKLIAETIKFITELNPIISLTNFLANIALEFCNYYIKRSDIQELKKTFHIRKKPQKYKKLKKIVIVRELSLLRPDDIAYLNFIGYLIKKGYITSVALMVISDQEYGLSNFLDASCTIDLPFTEKDYEIITGNPPLNAHMLEIINTLGIKCIKELEQFYNSDNNIVLKSARDIIFLLIREKNYDSISDQIDYF